VLKAKQETRPRESVRGRRYAPPAHAFAQAQSQQAATRPSARPLPAVRRSRAPRRAAGRAQRRPQSGAAAHVLVVLVVPICAARHARR